MVCENYFETASEILVLDKDYQWKQKPSEERWKGNCISVQCQHIMTQIIY